MFKKHQVIKIKYFSNDLPKVHKIAVGDWIDLYSACDVSIPAGSCKLIPLGVAMQLPEGYEAHLASRSSTFKQWHILQTNAPAIIDESYCGDNDQWFFSALAMQDTSIAKGDRICHFRIIKKMPEVQFLQVEHLNNPDRGGFGSTGKSAFEEVAAITAAIVNVQ